MPGRKPGIFFVALHYEAITFLCVQCITILSFLLILVYDVVIALIFYA